MPGREGKGWEGKGRKGKGRKEKGEIYNENMDADLQVLY